MLEQVQVIFKKSFFYSSCKRLPQFYRNGCQVVLGNFLLKFLEPTWENQNFEYFRL